MRIKRKTFLYLEHELMHYHDTLHEIERTRRDILFGGKSTDDENIGGGRSNMPGDVTGSKAISLITNSRLEHMERITSVIDKVFERLQPEKRKLVQLMYWDRPRMLTWDGAAIKLHIHKRTAFRWRNEILHAIASHGGFQ